MSRVVQTPVPRTRLGMITLSVHWTGVVTVSLFSRSVGVSMIKSVVGSVSVFIRVYQAPPYGFYDVQFGAVDLVGESVYALREWCILPSSRGG